MSENFRDKTERMWPTHGRMSREDYQLSFKARWKSRWRFFRRLGLWRALRHPLQFKHQMRVCAIDILKYQDCVRRRNEYLDLFYQPTPPARTENAVLFGDVLITDLPLLGHFDAEKSPGGAKQTSPEAPAPVQQEKSNGMQNQEGG